MIASNKPEIAEYEGLVDRYGLEKTWTHALLPALALAIRPDLSISDMPVPIADASDGLVALSALPERAGELYEYGLAYADKDTKKKFGQYYTPRDVATFMAGKLLEALESDGASIEDVSLVDPCVGCGGLLFPLLDLIDSPWEVISGGLRLYDQDACAANITKTMLLVRYAPENAAVSLDSIFSHIGDFLADDVILSGKDAIIANPPYGRVDATLYPGFGSRKAQDLYALFLEKSLEAGYVSIITPQSFIGSPRFEPLRRILMERSNGIVYPYDNIPSPIFCGRKHGVFNTNTSNSVRAAITCFGQGAGDWRVLPLMRFRAEEREKLFECSERICAQAYPQQGSDLWLKLPRSLESVFLGDDKICLSDIVSGDDAPYALHVPSTPRYYTTAAVRNLNRSSKIVLHFESREDMAVAYVLVNSSIAYGWWRICDGGITLATSVLLSTPFKYPAEEDMPSIISRFEEQSALECKRLSVKMNAGKPNENIKIGSCETAKNTQLISPGLADADYEALAGFHANEMAALVRAWCK